MFIDLKGKEPPGQPKKIQDIELQTLLNERSTTNGRVSRRTICDRLHVTGKFKKLGKWVEWQTDGKAQNGEVLLSRHKRKAFLHGIVTGNEKLIYVENPKCIRS